MIFFWLCIFFLESFLSFGGGEDNTFDLTMFIWAWRWYLVFVSFLLICEAWGMVSDLQEVLRGMSQIL